MAYRHIIWDWNGTLLDDAWLSVHTVNQLLGEEGLESLDQQRYAEVFGWPLEDYYRALGFEFDAETFGHFCTRWYDIYQAKEAECGLRTKATEILSAVAEIGLGQSVLSAYQHDPLEGLIRNFGISDHFDPVIGLRPEDGLSKVARGREWFQSTGMGPHEALFVGDTLHDLEVAEAIGVDCLLVTSGHQTVDRLKAGGTRVVECLSEVLEVIG